MKDHILECLPPDCTRAIEYREGSWQPLLGDSNKIDPGDPKLEVLSCFGLERVKLVADAPISPQYRNCLIKLLEVRLRNRCREQFQPGGDSLAGLKELLAAQDIQSQSNLDHQIDLGSAAREFFRLPAVCWSTELPGEPDTDQLAAVLEEESRVALAGLKSDDYSSLLGVFGHHVGTLFKTSGAMTIWSQPDPGDDPVRRVLDKLLPIWGVSQAISLHKKQGEKGWTELLRDWVNPSWAEREDLNDEVQRSIISLALYLYAHGVDEPPFLPWVVHLPDGRQARWVWATSDTVEEGVPEELIEQAVPDQTPDSVEIESQTHRLVSLPPLADNPILFDKTLALTIGLFEVLSNLRKYPEPRGAGREDRMDLAQLKDAERQVDLFIEETNGSTILRIVQPVVVLPDGGIPRSRSVERIRGLERTLLNGIIETGRAEVSDETSVSYVVKMEQTWTYHWTKLLEEWRCHVS